MNASLRFSLPRYSLVIGALAMMVAGFSVVHAADQKKKKDRKNPTSKVYFSDVSGEAEIDTGENVEDLEKRSVYNAEGTVIQTKKPKTEEDRTKYYSTMVYSNGTGAFFDADTRVEVRRFMQEPFTPNRNDADVEPSISQTTAFVSKGAVGLCTSKLVAGSNMVYATQQGSVNIRGRKAVVEAAGNTTKISMLEGDSTVRSGPQDLGGHIVHAGEQAVIVQSTNGQPNQIQISKIPQEEASDLDQKVAMACMAKKTVYFDVREKTITNQNIGGGSNQAGEEGSSGGVTAFDGSGGRTNTNTGGTTREIVPVEVVPSTLPTQFTVSPARLTTPTTSTGGE